MEIDEKEEVVDMGWKTVEVLKSGKVRKPGQQTMSRLSTAKKHR